MSISRTYHRSTREEPERIRDKNIAANADDPRWYRRREEVLYYAKEILP